MTTVLSETVCVAGSITQTAGVTPTDQRALAGSTTALRDASRTLPATAAPSVICGGGFWIAIFTCTVPVDGSMVGDTSRTVPCAFTFGSVTSAISIELTSGRRRNADS